MFDLEGLLRRVIREEVAAALAAAPRSTEHDRGAEELLGVASVARLADCNARTVRRAHAAGRLVAAGAVGKRLRFRRADVEAWLRAGSPQSETDDEAVARVLG